MPRKPTAAPAAETAPAWDNPLIPNKKLREIYTALVQLRLLEEHVAALQQRAKAAARLHSALGEEAARVSVALSQRPGDLTSDARPGISADFLGGVKLPDILHRVYALTSGARKDNAPASKQNPAQLPILDDTADRLHLAMGAALGVASSRKGALAVAYVYPGDLLLPRWKSIFRMISAHCAPMLLVALNGPSTTGTSLKSGVLSHTSTACGVPGIPVDAADPVALYRVAQESMLRARAGGGPVLMECIPFQLGGQKPVPADPVITLQHFMLSRKIVTQEWIDSVATRFASRLKDAAR
jgi:TPP-dependent pyruvate/acetoin dehydrogenase alpha subunit